MSVFHTACAQSGLPKVIEREQASAERSEQYQRTREEHSPVVRFYSYGSVVSFPDYFIRKQLYAGLQFSRETALKNRVSDWSGGAACGKGLECFAEVSRLERFWDWLLL